MTNFVSGRNESLGDGARGTGKSPLNSEIKVIYYGRVMQITDDGTNRIKVRIKGLDDKKPTNDDLPWAHSFLPMMLNILPQEGETVKIILMDTKNPDIGREWVGPLISQPDRIKRDPHFYTSMSGREGSLLKLGTSITYLPDTEGVYPKPDDISIIGRNNTDIIQRKEEITLRVGKHLPDNPLKRNEKNPAYIDILMLRPSELNKPNDGNDGSKDIKKSLNISDDRTDITVLSNKIFLIGRDSNSKIIKPLLSKNDHITLEDNLHPLVYGDTLLEFMLLFQNWMVSHIHEGDRLGSDLSGDTLKLMNWFKDRLPSLISKNIWAGGDIPVKNGRKL